MLWLLAYPGRQTKKIIDFTRASLNSSASHLFQTPPPFSDWLYADRLHAIDR
ncbi:hypothetical protein T03_2664 [Trichinella britovi]|uniref:Uncharacterized protein n=1 Tax=Trichinella britovi TaxID=45882 RepID=A0A0V1C5K5_TRIBR|nr:hypothetical protein T03_2664 [Trichinella britovi]